MPQHISAAILGFVHSDVADQVDEAAEVGGIEVAAGIDFGQHAAQAGVIALDGVHGVVNIFADFGRFGAGLQIAPTGGGRHEEDVFGPVFIPIFWISAKIFLGHQLGVQRLEGVGDVFEEDEAEEDVFIFGGVDVLAQLVGRFPQLFFEGFFFGVALFSRKFHLFHS